MDIKAEQSYNVVKSNSLIQNTRYNLSVVEQRIILRLIQIIKPTDVRFEYYQFSIKEFCEICGISDQSGQTYNYIKNTVRQLRDKSFVIKDGSEEIICGWINEAVFNNESGIIKILLSEKLKPYLLELKNNFTEYSLYFILGMRSKYSIRLYELLKSHQYKKTFEIDIEQLKASLLAETYDRFFDFKRKVIEIAVQEINCYSDIIAEYSCKKVGRGFKTISFNVRYKNADEQRRLMIEIDERLNAEKYVE